MTRSRRHYLIVAGILAAGFILGEVYMRWLVQVGVGESVPLAQPLKTIPMQAGQWRGTNHDIPTDQLMKIAAEDTLLRTYERRTTGKGASALSLYIAYFGGVRGTAPHHPDVCMPGAGWEIIDRDMPTLDVGLAEPVEVHQDVFEHIVDQQKRLVVWWEYVHGENVASRTMQRLKWVLPSFLGGKRGSVLQVQVSIDYGDDVAPAKEVVKDFMKALGPSLREVLPKAPAATSVSAE
jgi:EpsI family protein